MDLDLALVESMPGTLDADSSVADILSLENGEGKSIEFNVYKMLSSWYQSW